ncbi:MAG: hypothetical protein Q4G40_05990 [Brachybacterium sp.]|nr:hypothetical protein [Brachybacterium sp.]
MTPRFRRPASLTPHQQDQIPGEPDPQATADLAHRSADALLAGVRADTDPGIVDRVVRLARTDGLEDLAELWSGAPAVSLPGALWRLYVLHSWAHRDAHDVVRRYREGSRTVPGLRYLAGLSEPPDVDGVRRSVDEILRGVFTGDLAVALGRAAAVMMLCAYGTAHLDSEEGLTAQAGRLLSTGEELAAAARAEEAGALR